MATDRELLVDAFVRVRIALQHPDISSNERAILEMEYVRGWDEDEVRDCLCMTQREYRKTKAEALDKACLMPRVSKRASAVEPKEDEAQGRQ